MMSSLRAELLCATSDGGEARAAAARLGPSPSPAVWTHLGRVVEREAAEGTDAAGPAALALQSLALRCLRAAAEAAPAHDPSVYFELAGAFARAGEYARAIACMVDVLCRAPWEHERWRALSHLARAAGRKADAAHCLLMALRAHPDSEGGRRWSFTRRSCQRLLMYRRFEALNDAAHAGAWGAAIGAAVTAANASAGAEGGALVLDAGEGHGVHAMVALRAGAALAVRCEPLLPVAVRELAARNAAACVPPAPAAGGGGGGVGAEERLAVFPDEPTALELAPARAPAGQPAPQRPRDALVRADGASPASSSAPRLLCRPADLLIVDPLRADALASGLPAIVANARARGLLAPGAPVLPRAVWLRGALVESKALASLGRVGGPVGGADVSEFNRFRPAHRTVRAEHFAWRPLSAPALLAGWEAAAAAADPSGAGSCCGLTQPHAQTSMAATCSGRVDALLFWSELELGGATEAQAEPGLGGQPAAGPPLPPPDGEPSRALRLGSAGGCAEQTVLFLEPPLQLRAGDALTLRTRHDGRELRATLTAIGADGAERRSDSHRGTGAEGGGEGEGGAAGCDTRASEQEEAPGADGGPSKYHFAMLADEGRATAYDDAIRRALDDALADARGAEGGAEGADGAGVGGAELHALDIGTGSGLLSLLLAAAHAERAAAGAVPRLRVHACEAMPAVAAVARASLGRVGLGGCVRVLGRQSSALAVRGEGRARAAAGDADARSSSGSDDEPLDGEEAEAEEGGSSGARPLLPARCGLCVSEVLGTDPLCEGVLPALAHAHRCLLAPGARVVPRLLRLLVAIVECEALAATNRAPPVGSAGARGLDLSALDCARHARRGVRLDELAPFRLLTEPAALFEIDLSTPPLQSRGERRLHLPIAASGRAHAAVVWFEAELYEGVPPLSTHWSTGQARGYAWGQMAHFFARAELPLRAGGSFALRARYTPRGVAVEPVLLC